MKINFLVNLLESITGKKVSLTEDPYSHEQNDPSWHDEDHNGTINLPLYYAVDGADLGTVGPDEVHFLEGGDGDNLADLIPNYQGFPWVSVQGIDNYMTCNVAVNYTITTNRGNYGGAYINSIVEPKTKTQIEATDSMNKQFDQYMESTHGEDESGLDEDKYEDFRNKMN